ncbi:MAG: hypothetical protein EBR40_00615, partial [Proteobacteria bacterium]|nr:hypothetical protein [Pseudomonadota bacterium]
MPYKSLLRCFFIPRLNPGRFFSGFLILVTIFTSPALLAVAGDTPGNLLLFFRETDSAAFGANDNMAIDLGSFPSNQSGFRYDFSGNSIISQTYGNDWFQRDTLFWGIMGFISYDDPVAEGDANNMKLFISRQSSSTVLGQITGVSLYDLAQKWPDLNVNVTTGRVGTANVSGANLSYSVFEKGQKAWSDMQEDPSGAFAGAISYTGNSDHQVTMNPDLILSQYTPDPVDFGNVALSANLLSIRFTNGILSATNISGGGGSGGYSGPWNWTTGSGNWSDTSNWTNGKAASDGTAVGITGTSGGAITNNAVTNLSSLTYSNSAGAFTLGGTNASQTLTITGGITNNSAATQTISLGLNTTSNQIFNAAAGNLTLAAISNTAALTMQESAGRAITVSGEISGNGSLIQSGAGTLNLNGANSYSGGTTLNGGTVVAGNSESFGSGGISVASNAVIAAG